jgi:hypothetical protein
MRDAEPSKVGEPTATVPEMTPPRPARRFPPPWSIEETDACFIVRDHNGQALAYVYFQEEPGRRAAAKLLTHDEARRIAANIARAPDTPSEVARCNCVK